MVTGSRELLMLDKVYRPKEIDAKWSGIWREEGVFTADAGSKDTPFTIILPPPNITGILTVGHALGTTIQDILVRWKRLRGSHVLWLPGTDHAGIATQKVVERSLAERGISREELGREKFLEECWKWKDRYHRSIVEQLERLGASLDWTREVFTLDPGVSRAVREVFVRLYGKGLIYRGRYIVNWRPSCKTAISDEEVEFRDRHGKLYYIAYPFADGDGEVVVGTTRPETMLGDVAVAISAEDERARALEGKLLILPLTGREIPVILDEAVDPQFGTGCLKVTPAHDAVDFEIGRRHGLEPVVVIDQEGSMSEETGRFSGLERFEARDRVLEALKSEGYLRNIEDYDHMIGHHDRCDTIIEPVISQHWFLGMKQLAAPGIAVVNDGGLSFHPERWKNIYLSWMENIKDWCISRQLWWGHRIPVWYCGPCGEEIVAVEAPQRCPKCNSASLTQEEDVLDTWFSSWLWTFSPMGWPAETEDLKTFHPADVLVTGGDIIFFWVARMVMAAFEFMGEKPFSHVLITAMVRDAKGCKYSKSLGNSPDPNTLAAQYGADAFRFTLVMLSSPGQDLLFDEKRIEMGKHFANKIWNAARFVLRQAEQQELFRAPASDTDPITGLFGALFGSGPDGGCEFGWEDRWIVSRMQRGADEYARSIEQFRLDEAARTFYDFFWHEFCDWYLELSKQALRDGGTRARGAAVTARTVLGMSLALIHPYMPFVTEEIWSMLSPDPPLLAGFRIPEAPQGISDASIEEDVSMFKEIVTSVRNLRQSFRLPPAQKVDAILNCESGSPWRAKLERYRDQIRLMANIDALEITEGASKPSGAAAAGLASLEIYVPLEGVIDLEVERKRLQRELERMSREYEKLDKRLREGKFLERAPQDVIERERERFAEFADRIKHIRKIMEDL